MPADLLLNFDVHDPSVSPPPAPPPSPPPPVPPAAAA
jgi:hypothetical protein